MHDIVVRRVFGRFSSVMCHRIAHFRAPDLRRGLFLRFTDCTNVPSDQTT